MPWRRFGHGGASTRPRTSDPFCSYLVLGPLPGLVMAARALVHVQPLQARRLACWRLFGPETPSGPGGLLRGEAARDGQRVVQRRALHATGCVMDAAAVSPARPVARCRAYRRVPAAPPLPRHRAAYLSLGRRGAGRLGAASGTATCSPGICTRARAAAKSGRQRPDPRRRAADEIEGKLDGPRR